MAIPPTIHELIGVPGESFTEDDFRDAMIALADWLRELEVQGVEGRLIGITTTQEQ